MDNKQKIVEEIRDCMDSTTNRYVFENIDDESKDQIKKSAEKILNKLPHQYSSVDNVTTLWWSWSTWEKLTWVFKHKFHFGLKELKLHKQFMDAVAISLAGNVIEEERFDIFSAIDKASSKWWYESHPEQIVIASVSIVPVKPLEYMEIKFTIPKGD